MVGIGVGVADGEVVERDGDVEDMLGELLHAAKRIITANAFEKPLVNRNSGPRDN
jgi:hypothetical protein